MSVITENYKQVTGQLPDSVQLVAVSKFQSGSSILELYQQGQRVFGESKVQELLEKYESLPKDIQWHFIGHLQTNKIKYIVPFVSLIHGIDSLKLLKEVNKSAQKINQTVSCLLQMHIAKEETKFGFSFDEMDEILSSGQLHELSNVQIRGLMGMATYTDNIVQIQKEFSILACYFGKLKETYFSDNPFFNQLSMGMSGDYRLAIGEGSTMVRIGSSIFGERNY